MLLQSPQAHDLGTTRTLAHHAMLRAFLQGRIPREIAQLGLHPDEDRDIALLRRFNFLGDERSFRHAFVRPFRALPAHHQANLPVMRWISPFPSRAGDIVSSSHLRSSSWCKYWISQSVRLYHVSRQEAMLNDSIISRIVAIITLHWLIETEAL